jgi:hypothetical protein
LRAAISQSLGVVLLVSIFWLLFAIVGVQTFASELKRSCVSLNTSASASNSTQPLSGFGQSCGGWVDTNGTAQPWQYVNGRYGDYKPKGYLYPQPLVCVEGDNPFNGTLNFDDLGHSLELAFIVISSSSFSNAMHHVIDSDSLASALCKFLMGLKFISTFAYCSTDFALLFVAIRLWLVNVVSEIPSSHSWAGNLLMLKIAHLNCSVSFRYPRRALETKIRPYKTVSGGVCNLFEHQD